MVIENDSNRFRITLSPIYLKKFNKLKTELGLNNRELIYYLIDYIEIEDTKQLSFFRNKLTKRLKQGVGLSYIIQIKIIKTIIETFLKKINYE